MRSREEIVDLMEKLTERKQPELLLQVQIHILLDIRDLLTKDK